MQSIFFKRFFQAFLFFCVFSASNIYAGTGESFEIPLLISSLKIDSPLDFCSERAPLKEQEILERLEKELMLSLWDRPQVILWLKRSTRYFPHIEDALKKNGLPDDLKYVAIAESALRPHVGSRKGAIGFWQFMAGTGRIQGLVINQNIDERRNLFASTRAALTHLKELNKKFNSWTLAAAAYNMGEEGLMAEILEQGSKDYYHLYLPLETQRYIFRILSIKLIFSDPEKFGFKLEEGDYYPPLTFDSVQVICTQDIPLRLIAGAAETHFKKIKDLNPQIRGHYLTKGKHEILLPKGSLNGFQAKYEANVAEYMATHKERIYVVKKGDNLSAIADRFGVPLNAILIWNRINLNRPIYPGDRLIIYSQDMNSVQQ